MSPQVIDGGYIARTMAEDWGFWYDATNNIKLIQDLGQSLLDEEKIPKSAWDTISSNPEATFPHRFPRKISALENKRKGRNKKIVVQGGFGADVTLSFDR
jgi:hypothetical protein